MSISYNVVPNALTNPPSFTARVEANTVLDYQELAVQINLHNPTIPVVTAKSVLEALREEVKTQLLNGNTVKMTNFVSFVPTLPVNLAAATDPLPSSPLDIKAKPSATFKTECNQDAQYNRLGYPTKDPSIIEATDTNTGLIAYMENGRGFRIDGRNLGYDVTDAELGIFTTDSAGLETRQTNVSINDPSRIVITPTGALANTSYVETTLTAKNRYTTNGTVRTGTYQRKIRTAVQLGAARDNLVFCIGVTTSQVEVTSVTETSGQVVLVAYLNQSNVIEVKAKKVGGEFGAVVQITGTGVYDITYDGGGETIQITVGSLTVLNDNIVAYSRYMQEVINMAALS